VLLPSLLGIRGMRRRRPWLVVSLGLRRAVELGEVAARALASAWVAGWGAPIARL
jgi:hypothetical protein